MRVIHVSTVHARDDVRIFKKECVTLARSGYEVLLVVADGNGDAIVQDVAVRDIGVRSRSRIIRALVNSHQAVLRAVRLKPTLLHIHDPELLIAVWIAKFYGVAVIYDIHEDTRVQILLKNHIPVSLRKFASRTFGWFEDFIARKLAALVVPQESMRERYNRLNRCINLPNYVDLNLYPSLDKVFTRPQVFHAGGLSVERGLQNMIMAANTLGSRGEMYVAGKLPGNVSIKDLGKLQCLGSLKYDDVIHWYCKTNIGVILYNNVGQYHMAGAVKSFEYMAASMPIIMPDFGEWVDFNRKTGCGINVNVTDPNAVVNAILHLTEHPLEAARMGRNGRKYVEREYSWQFVSGRLIDLYQNLCEG